MQPQDALCLSWKPSFHIGNQSTSKRINGRHCIELVGKGGPEIVDLLLKTGMKPTAVKTDEPPGLWPPYDIATFHQY